MKRRNFLTTTAAVTSTALTGSSNQLSASQVLAAAEKKEENKPKTEIYRDMRRGLPLPGRFPEWPFEKTLSQLTSFTRGTHVWKRLRKTESFPSDAWASTGKMHRPELYSGLTDEPEWQVHHRLTADWATMYAFSTGETFIAHIRPARWNFMGRYQNSRPRLKGVSTTTEFGILARFTLKHFASVSWVGNSRFLRLSKPLFYVNFLFNGPVQICGPDDLALASATDYAVGRLGSMTLRDLQLEARQPNE